MKKIDNFCHKIEQALCQFVVACEGILGGLQLMPAVKPQSMERITNNLFHVIWMCKAMGVIWSRLKLQELSDAFFASSSFSYSVFVFVCFLYSRQQWVDFFSFLFRKKVHAFSQAKRREIILGDPILLSLRSSCSQVFALFSEKNIAIFCP